MNDDAMNLGIRRFLKEFGVTAQREIERAVATAARNGQLPAGGTLKARVQLDLPDVGMHLDLERGIPLE